MQSSEAASLSRARADYDAAQSSAAAATISSAEAEASSAEASAEAEANAPKTVVMTVTGDGVSIAGSITYDTFNASGSPQQAQANGVRLPWSKAQTVLSVPTMSLVAQSGSDGNGSISCMITVNGQVLASNTSTGQYAVVTCIGR